MMKIGRFFLYFMIAMFFLGLARPDFSFGLGEEIKGTVTMIEGVKVSIKDSMGSEKSVEPKNPEALTDLKIGDRASFKDGILTKEGGAMPAAPAPGPRY